MNDTSTPPSDQGATAPGGPAAGPRVTRDEMKDVRRLRRPHDRVVAGVAAGVARHFDVDPLVVRVAFVVLSFFGGAGLLLYAAGWLLLPEDGSDDAPLPLDERSRGIALLGVLAVGVLAVLGNSAGLYWFPWPLAVIGVIAWFFYDRSKKAAERQTGVAQTQAPQPYGPQPAPQAYGPQPEPQPAPYEQTTPYAYAAAPTASPMPPPPPPPVTRPRDPRRRGPILFGFTLALVALAMGVLGTVDLAGVNVVDSAYPALALTVVAVMLVVGAFWGRAGGLILLALIAGTVTVGTMATEGWESEHVEHVPPTASAVRDHYELRSGELVVDLSNVVDVANLDSRRVRAELGVGTLQVVVPADVDVRVNADIGVGAVRVLDRGERGGVGRSYSEFHPAPEQAADTPTLHLDLDVGVGEIEVRRASYDEQEAGR